MMVAKNVKGGLDMLRQAASGQAPVNTPPAEQVKLKKERLIKLITKADNLDAPKEVAWMCSVDNRINGAMFFALFLMCIFFANAAKFQFEVAGISLAVRAKQHGMRSAVAEFGPRTPCATTARHIEYRRQCS
jgi:hypothetical protein